MPRILVTDDDPVQLNLWKMVLESVGHKVTVALDCAGTLRQLELRPPDLVIIDLRLPNAYGDADADEGRALIRGMRESGCPTPVIVLSGWPEEIAGRPEEAMVSRVMTKPVPALLLLGAISEVLA
jgi:CheY-like chemotaxis protein